MNHVQRSSLHLILICLLVAVFISPLSACPFCPTLKPTFAQQYDQCDWLAFCSVAEQAVVDVVNEKTGKKKNDPDHIDTRFKVQKILKQPKDDKHEKLDKILICVDAPGPTLGTFVMLFGEKRDDKTKPIEWNIESVSELGAGYIAKMPDLRQPAEKRLLYYVKYLENHDDAIANDALQEFAHADLTDVKAALRGMNFASLRDWLTDENVSPEHKGFYGMVLGLACAEQKKLDDQVESAKSSTAQKEVAEQKRVIMPIPQELNRKLLQKLVMSSGSDFRAGYDGILAGYLLAHESEGLNFVQEKLLTNPKSPIGDVLHSAKALRFYQDECPIELREKTSSVVANLLKWPQCAAGAITDLARWKNWSVLDTVIGLYDDKQTDVGIQYAVVGYLKACPEQKAREALDHLRQNDPKGVAKAEAWLKLSQQGK